MKKYIDNQIKWLKEYVDAEIRSVREAVGKVEKTNTAKFDAQNEWRGALNDTITNLARKESVEEMKRSIENAISQQNIKIGELERVNSNRDGRMWAIGVTWTVITVIAMILLKYIG